MKSTRFKNFLFFAAAFFILSGGPAVSRAEEGMESRIVPYDSEEVTLNLAVGEEAMAAGDLEGALLAYSRAFMLDQKSYPAVYNLGYICQMRNKTDEAVRYFRLAAKLAPERGEPLLSLGSVLMLQKKNSEAAECFAGALKIDPSSADAKFDLAAAYVADRKFTHAYEILSSLVSNGGKTSKADADAQLKFASVCIELEKFREAEALLSKTEPVSDEGIIEKHYLKGVIFRKTGRTNDALKAFADARAAADKTGSPSLRALLDEKIGAPAPKQDNTKGRIAE